MNGDTAKNMEENFGGGELTRRQFLKRLGVLGGGLVVYFTVGDIPVSARMKREGFLGAKIPVDFNAFLRIGTDERVALLTGKIEMGQGVMTSLPQLLAEEMNVSYDMVDIVMGDTDLCPWDAGTFGSLSIRYFGLFLREAACEAKAVLMQMAAKRLKVPVDALAVENGTIFAKGAKQKKVTYGQLTQGKIIERHLETLPPLKPVSEFTVMGTPRQRRDAIQKVTGEAKFAADMRLPGMLYAKILRPPAHGAKLIGVDVSEAEKIKGVKVVREGDFVAVLHETPDGAAEGLRMIRAEFDELATGIDDKNIYEHFLKNAPPAEVAEEAGSLESGEKASAELFEKNYYNAYVAHAPMEPHAAVAQVSGGKAEVWASTQTPFRLRDQVAEALGFSSENVRIRVPFLGGGFGGKSASMQGIEAARLSKAVGRPVQVAWSRAEEFFFDTFRPAAVVKIKSGMDAEGKIVLWDYHVYCAGRRGSEQFYDIANHRETTYGSWRGGNSGVHPFAVGPWRAPAANTNVYARELHLNLMAQKAGIDPLAFRLQNLADKRMVGVLEAVAKKFGYTPAKVPSGRGYGISCGIDAGTYVAAMAEVAVDKVSGIVNVKRVACAQDMGFVVNPPGARTQMEGCVNMGLGYALGEEIRFKDGKIFDLNFDTYSVARFSWTPSTETVLVENPDLSPQGGGEPSIINMGGVIATAIHDACGAAVFELPMTAERVKKAIDGA